MTAAPAHPIRRGRKFDQVLKGARSIFLRDGFERASVDEIAREAGVSKATLYSYFPDKSLLFLEMAMAECRRQADEAVSRIDTGAGAAEVLRAIAGRIVVLQTSDIGLRIFRVCLAESERFPDLARTFYRSGPAAARAWLATYLREAADRGELSIDDFDLAADQFSQLCKAGLHERLLFGVGRAVSADDRQRTAEAAVTTFLARYGAPGTRTGS